MSLNIGILKEATSTIEGKLQPEDGGNLISYSDEGYVQKELAPEDTVCYELVFIGSTPIATNLIKVEASKTTVWNGGVHDAIDVGGPGDTGALLIVKGNATVNGSTRVTGSTIMIEGGSTFNGSISAVQRSVIGVQEASRVDGSLDSHQGINLLVKAGSTVTGSVEFKAAPDSDNDSMTISNSTIGINVIGEKQKSVKIIDNNNGTSIGGKIDIKRAEDVVITNNKVNGAEGITAFNVDTCEICYNELADGAPLNVPAACISGC